MAIPAHPLALTGEKKLDERSQKALTRYYLDAGAGGLAVGVHTTQFAIRSPKARLYRPVLELAMNEARSRDVVMVAGLVGQTEQAVREAEIARTIGYHCGLLSLAALQDQTVGRMVAHVRAVAEVIPVFGFYLQPAVGGCLLPVEFWRAFAQIENVVAIKAAPFDRYRTFDVLRGVAESGRAREIALYTGNDDNIVLDLLTTTVVNDVELHFAGGLLGHWAVWTKCAVDLWRSARAERQQGTVPARTLTLAQEVTDMNAEVFDVANSFRGCIAGIHYVLHGLGLMQGRWCLDPDEDLSPGQAAGIERVRRAYPHLLDDGFVQENLARWRGE
ncbi:MAG: dihydrodipicolinate synthase family protein [Acidobacteriota bacterium]|nr:dihydrodipicolinate synthase family protein [Acidobacteriota bacterium]